MKQLLDYIQDKKVKNGTITLKSCSLNTKIIFDIGILKTV